MCVSELPPNDSETDCKALKAAKLHNPAISTLYVPLALCKHEKGRMIWTIKPAEIADRKS